MKGSVTAELVNPAWPSGSRRATPPPPPPTSAFSPSSSPPPLLRSEIAFLKGRPLVTNDTHPSSADSSIRVSFSIEVDERGTDERGSPSVSIHFLLASTGFFPSWKQHLFDSRPRRSARETCPDRWRTLRPKGWWQRERKRDSGNDAVGNAVSADNGGENPRPRFLYLFVHAILAGHAFDEISGFPTRRH